MMTELLLLTLLIGLAGPASARNSSCEAEGAGDCHRADAEVAFVLGLGENRSRVSKTLGHDTGGEGIFRMFLKHR